MQLLNSVLDTLISKAVEAAEREQDRDTEEEGM